MRVVVVKTRLSDKVQSSNKARTTHRRQHRSASTSYPTTSRYHHVEKRLYIIIRVVFDRFIHLPIVQYAILRD